MSRRLLTLTLLAPVLLMAACRTAEPVGRESYKPRYEAVNVASTAILPVDVQRIVVLPLYADGRAEMEFASELDGVLLAELGRQNAFEIVPIARDGLFDLFAAKQFASVGILPNDFLSRLREAYAADAVLLADLTVYQPYRPISIGLRAKLVDLRSGQIFWAVDAVFDSADPAVAQAARDFGGRATYNPYPVDGSNIILQSPRRFADFVVYSIFRTLPPRS